MFCYVELMMDVAHSKHVFYETKRVVVLLNRCIISLVLLFFGIETSGYEEGVVLNLSHMQTVENL